MTKETKAAPAAQDALMRAFESFKEANDQRLAAIERGRGDVLLEEKVDRIDRALGEQKSMLERIALAGRRPNLAADPAVSEHKSAWNAYIRRGDESAFASFEAKALAVGANAGADGGYVAPPELDRLIESWLRQVSPMREIATVRTTGATVFKKPISLTAAGAGWVSETSSRTQTDTPTLALLEFPTAELYANLAATQTLLDDSFVNLEEWIATEVEEASADAEIVLNGANVFAIESDAGEWEIVQARDCVLVEPGLYELSGFLRGQLGSEHAMRSPHPVGARIVKLDARLARLSIGAHEWGNELVFSAPPAGGAFNDARAAWIDAALPHAAVRPWPPAHPRAKRVSGDVHISWVRRAHRHGDQWGAGHPPVGFGSEAYRLDILDGAALKRSVTVSSPVYVYSAADQTADFGSLPGSLSLRVAQLGDGGAPGLQKQTTVLL